LVAVQIETADSIKNIDEILSVEGVDIAFLGKNDLAMSMGLFEKYEFPHMYTSPELNAAVAKLLAACKKHNKIAGIFMFGTDGVEDALKSGFSFVSVGNDLHHVLVANTQMTNTIKDVSKRIGGKPWEGQESNLVQ
jgi:4-hydroxy-2-oxoheptanedioate aldolase